MRNALSRRRALVRALAAGLAALGLLRTADAHPHNTLPPVDLVLTIEGTEILAVLDVEKWQIASWGQPVEKPVDIESPLAPEEAVKRVPERLEVEIDGVLVPPRLKRFDDPPVNPKDLAPRVKLAVTYTAAKKPTTVRIRWKSFLGIMWETEQQVPLTMSAESQIDTFTLTKVETEFTWHRRPPAAFRSAAAPPPAPPVQSRLPLVPLGLGLLGLVLPFVGPVRRRLGAVRWAASGALLGVGGLLVALGVGQVETPWGRAHPPTEDQARAVFVGLLRNVYRSFDAKDEGAIYDLLRASVEPQLIDGIYGDVYESLVLRDQGGAVAHVEDVTAGNVAIAFPANGSATQFTADATWVLDAAIVHLGHPHRRKNQYRAEVVVRHDGASWHFASVRMLERKRLDDGKGGLLDAPQELPVHEPDPPPTPAGPTR